jgi:hypothetical protein
MAKRYRVHLYADGGRGRWLASRDFTGRPDQETINAAFDLLQGPGWFEVRVNPLRGDDELSGWAWTQQDGTPGRKDQDPPTHLTGETDA